MAKVFIKRLFQKNTMIVMSIVSNFVCKCTLDVRCRGKQFCFPKSPDHCEKFQTDMGIMCGLM